MPKGRIISRLVTNTRPINMTLNLECIEEPLSQAQHNANEKLDESHHRLIAAIEDLIQIQGGNVISKLGTVTGYQYTLPVEEPRKLSGNTAKNTSQPITQNKNAPIKLNMLNNTNGGQTNIQLVMDPRMGVLLGPVSQQQNTPTTATVTSVASKPANEIQKYTRPVRRPKSIQPQPQPVAKPQPQPEVMEESIPVTRPILKAKAPIPLDNIAVPTTTSSQGLLNIKPKPVTAKSTSQPIWPTEQSSIGGIAVGSTNLACEQIEDSKKNLPDGREVTFNKMNGGRTFPSLVVVARPYLRTREISTTVAQKERSELDIKVKSVLMFSATKFAEWFIQQGLVRSEQYCILHSTNYQKVKLKLGMYSDQGTFPYSGGYVWVSSCCPDRFVSVFSGSIFQGAPYTPTVLLKLIYHWACQTNMQNVISWVKVSNIYIKNFYTNLRSICTAALWDKCQKMGGKHSVIQVGVISLGTTSQDGNLRQVKVEVLGVFNPTTLELRLRACDPVQDGDRSYKRRFNNILNPLKDWVHKDSKIMTDFTVDKTTLQEMGFSNVSQTTFSEQSPRNYASNYHIMEYLRKIVPRMFQNTLSLLSRQMIQQFLDELVWRENFGTTTARAFENIILHIAEQTRIDNSDCLLDRLAKIAANPFQNWAYSDLTPPPLTPIAVKSKDQSQIKSDTPVTKSPESLQINSGVKRTRKRVMPSIVNLEPEVKKATLDAKGPKDKDKENKNDQADLQGFYYATMEGDKHIPLKEQQISLQFKCFLCIKSMNCNTEIMEHMIEHVPPQVPGQSDYVVCRYCCTALSSKHQMDIHVSETHSHFGFSDSDMVVCAICEQKFGTSNLLVNHLFSMHNPSEIPYMCETCGYRTSSHKDAIDHYYKMHKKGDGLQCPFCLKVIQFIDGKICMSSVHAYLLHMQRHVVRREQGKGNKCYRCCLWFNQKGSLKHHQIELHKIIMSPKVVPYSSTGNKTMITKQRPIARRFDVESPPPELPDDDNIKRWSSGPIKINCHGHLLCQECEEDVEEEDHYPGEQKCQQCRYVTCCWRAFKEHQQQTHNERPMTSIVLPSPLINIPLDKEMYCQCGYSTIDGNQLATHLIKCKCVSAYPNKISGSSRMLNSLGLVPKSSSEDN
ncbi:uncharacterized protein row [Prorops nasuta]|uniref:uncharacterized protein row n=1 Tax=Prorops nasuta TaxID=863751 RepID=UPI0034D0221F